MRTVEDFYDKSRTVTVTIRKRLYMLDSWQLVIRIIYFTVVVNTIIMTQFKKDLI